MSLLEEFKAWVARGNVIDLAVAFVMGLAFNAVVQAFVGDLITPLIGAAVHLDFSSVKGTLNGSTFLVGDLVNKLIAFLVVAAVLFFLIVKPLMVLEARRKRAEAVKPPTTRECPACLSPIPRKARRCAFCTSDVTPMD